jgi:hypothetical protein
MYLLTSKKKLLAHHTYCNKEKTITTKSSIETIIYAQPAQLINKPENHDQKG